MTCSLCNTYSVVSSIRRKYFTNALCSEWNEQIQNCCFVAELLRKYFVLEDSFIE